MNAAKDNMNLPVKKTRTPLPSSPIPKFRSPAGTERHHGEGTEVSPTDLLMDRDKRSPQNDPHIMDHVGSQNKAQQIIKSASSNIEHSGNATAAAAVEQRFIVLNAVTPLSALPNPSMDCEVELSLETHSERGNRCNSTAEDRNMFSSFRLLELPEVLETMKFPNNIESKTKLPLARMREETQVNGEVGEIATVLFGVDDKGHKRKKTKRGWQCPACRKPCSTRDKLENHIIEEKGCQLEILKLESKFSCFASVPPKEVRKSSPEARMKFGQTSREYTETYMNVDHRRKEARHQIHNHVDLIAREENKRLTYSQNDQRSVAASTSLTTPGNEFTWPMENTKPLKSGNHTSKEVSCQACQESFPGQSELPPHRGNMVQYLPFKCIYRVDDTRVCPLAYETLKQLDDHVSMLHPAEHAASVLLKRRQAEFIEAQVIFRRRQSEFIAGQALLALGSRPADFAEVYSDEHADEGMLTD
jgi:hypothetical protein